MDQFISFIHENWFDATSTQLASYGLWRLNWIHPFIEGNGRTARAVCYYLLSVKEGRILGGSTIVPERIKVNRPQYINALRAADRAWDAGKLDLTEMEAFLAQLLSGTVRAREGGSRTSDHLTVSRFSPSSCADASNLQSVHLSVFEPFAGLFFGLLARSGI